MPLHFGVVSMPVHFGVHSKMRYAKLQSFIQCHMRLERSESARKKKEKNKMQKQNKTKQKQKQTNKTALYKIDQPVNYLEQQVRANRAS